MKSGKISAALVVIATSAVLLTACLGSQDGETDFADSPSYLNQVKSDQVKIIGGQPTQTPISGEGQNATKPSEPDRQQPALINKPTVPGPENTSPPAQESRTPDQGTGSEAVITPEPDPSAQAQAATSPVAEPPGNIPLQSSKAVKVDSRQYRQLLPRDAIAPIYTPQFLPASQASLDPGELVIGVEIGGESKAYPIGPLIRREMVNDVIAGVPILVTW